MAPTLNRWYTRNILKVRNDQTVTETSVFYGQAFCSVLAENPEHKSGMRGAFVPICVEAADYSNAVQLLEKELLEIHLQLQGLEEFYNERYFEGVPSAEMSALIDALQSYPVQYSNVHYFPPDA